MMSLTLSPFPALPGQGDRLKEGLGNSEEGARRALGAGLRGALRNANRLGPGEATRHQARSVTRGQAVP